MKKLIFLLLCLFILSSKNVIEASPLVMVEAEGIVDGYVGERIASKIIDLKLTDDNYYFEIDDYEEITDWFENIPEGLEAIVVGHIPTSIHVSFEGVPKEEKDEFIKVKVPDGHIIDSNSEDSIGDLENTPSEKAVYQITVKQPLAEYERESIVKGTVGETLKAQNVYVQLYNTTCEISMIGHEFPIHNGLTGKVKDILANNVIVIEYNGVPIETDQSLIHTLLLNADLKCDQDLPVADREDVRFDITEAEKPEPTPEPTPEPVPEKEVIIIEKPYIQPVTGVE